MAQALPLQYMQSASGLDNLVVTALAQDDKGRLWIGTENGLYLHDGSRIARADPEALPLADRQITALMPATQGGLWVGTTEALWLRRDGGFTQVTDQAGRPLPVALGQTLALTTAGDLLVLSKGQLKRVPAVPAASAAATWTPASLQAVPALPPEAQAKLTSLVLQSILVDREDSLWMGCGKALCRWQQGRLAQWTEKQGLPQTLWRSLLQARDGSIWARAPERVMQLPAGGQQFEARTPAELRPGTLHPQMPMAEDGLGRILTLEDGGLLRWDGSRWQRFGRSNGLEAAGGVHAILVDRDREVWLGTAGRGLARWSGYDHWSNWTMGQGLPDPEVWRFMRDSRGRFWLGTGSGVAQTSGGAGTTAPLQVHPTAGTAHQVGSVVEDAQHQLWMATFQGEVLRRDERSGRWRRAVAGLPVIYQLLPRPDGTLWAATDGGLYDIRPDGTGQAVARRIEAERSATGRDAAILNMCQDDAGRLWLATSAGLLLQLPGQGFTRPRVQGLPSATTAVWPLACGKHQRVYFATRDGGLWRMAPDAAGGWHAERVRAQALGRRNIQSLLEDRRGWLWVASDGGLLVTDGERWRRFDPSEGLVWGDCNQNALYEDEDGDIWVGTSQGASRISQPEQLLGQANLALDIASIRRAQETPDPALPWQANWSEQPLAIHWRVPVFANREGLRVWYRLRGQSDEWTVTSNQEVGFAALPEGDYSFEAWAENLDLGQRSATVSFSFQILPPWWRSQWARLGYAALIACLVMAAHRWRVGRLMHRQTELKRLVHERTQALEASHEQMRQLALTDGLTGALNRRAIMATAERELARARRSEPPVMLVLLDIDHFKRVNDRHGHPAGDAVLQAVVGCLQADIREYDALGRYGGEEFLLVLPGLSCATSAGRQRVEHLCRLVAQHPFALEDGTPLTVTCSMGAVDSTQAEGAAELKPLIDLADQALYRAKQQGRNRVAFASATEAQPRLG
ncbi:diguanylate cyclase [Ideonella sp.]